MATIKDVALAAGVSISTVSRVLNGVPSVRPDITRRVFDAVKALHYEPNLAGRSLRLQHDPVFGPHFGTRRAEFVEAKREIGRAAAGLVTAGDIVGLDSGTTVAAMVPFLPADIVVYTNSLAVIQPLSKRSATIYLAAGIYVPEMAAVYGPETEAFFRRNPVSRYFLSVARVDVWGGLYNVHPDTVRVKRVLMNNAREVILLADHHKFCDSGLKGFAPLEHVHTVVTDYVPDDYREKLAGSGVKIIETGKGEQSS